MPRGKYVNHKGKHRHFTDPEEIQEQMRREEKEKRWRAQKGDDSSDEDEEESAPSKQKEESEGSSSEEEEDSDEEGKAKGVENLIEVENPNRVQKKTKKLATLNESIKSSQASKPELSRKEREELNRQRAQAHYQRLHAEGKTDEARADLARLAIIKQQREEAAKKREDEKRQKEAAKNVKTAQTQKALGKRT